MNLDQLTYASADRVSGRASGGWGVLYRTPGLPSDVEERLVAGVSVALPSTVSSFPSNQELERRPVRLRHQPDVDDQHSLLWRSVEAGLDHTNRPGNVFTHAVRSPRGLHVRAVDWFDSQSWLAPFGPDQVSQAVPASTFEPAFESGIARVIAWLVKDTRRVGALPWITDVVMAALGQGRPVVIRVEDPVEARGWIGLISWLLTEPVAGNLTFSTYEDRTSVGRLLGQGAHMLATTDEFGELPANVLALDTAWQVAGAPAPLSGFWTLPSGVQMPQTAWSSLALELVSLQGELAACVLRAREDLGTRIIVRLNEDPMRAAELALGGAMLATPGAVATRRKEAICELLERLPYDVRDDPLIVPLVREVTCARSLRPAPQFEGADAPAVLATDALRSPGTEVSLVKAFPGSWFNAERANLRDYPYPTPASAMRAAAQLSRNHVELEGLLSGTRWMNELLGRPAEERLAILHIVSQNAEVCPTGEGVGALGGLLVAAPGFDRLAAAFLLLAARAEIVYGPESLPHSGSTPWFQAIGSFVGRRVPGELLYLSLHFGPLLRRVDGQSRQSDAAAVTITEWAKQPPPESVWGLACRSGDTLAQVVAAHIRLTQGTDT